MFEFILRLHSSMQDSINKMLPKLVNAHKIALSSPGGRSGLVGVDQKPMSVFEFGMIIFKAV